MPAALEGTGERVAIAPVAGDGLRPLWSVMIPTYNCASYLRKTLESVLGQDPGPEVMQIEVVDDFSTRDDPEAVVQEVGRGRVGFHQQPKNIGHTRNFESCLQRARGQLVHLLHGDDYVRRGFYATIGGAFHTNPEIGAAFCRTIFANQAGHWMGFSELERGEPGILDRFAERLAIRQRIQTPSIVVKRAVYEELGCFDRRLSWTEDWEMWVRVAVNYPIWFDPRPLAVYRSHDSSSTHSKILTGENVRDLRRCVAIMSEYFSRPVAGEVRGAALREGAGFALRTMDDLLRQGERKAALNQLREALKCRVGLGILWRAARIWSHYVFVV